MSKPTPDAGRGAGAAANGAPGVTALRIDSHLHLWELADGQYSWLTPEHGVLYNTFTGAQAKATLAAAGIGQAILVQADDTAADTEAMLAAAAANDWIIGVVGWLPLEDPAASAALLEKWGESPKFRGVRTLIHDDPRPDVLELAPVRESLALVEQFGLPFDVPDAFPRHLGQVADLARALPELTVVLDHLGKPPRGGAPEQMMLWKQQLGAVAALENTVAKVSGLHTSGAEYSADALNQIWDIALSAFGPDRLMFGGDWPVSLLGSSYQETVNLAATLFAALSPSERKSLWSGTAQRTYLR